METKKLELKDICGYLPYGLKVLCGFIGNSGICKITGIYKGGVFVDVGDGEVTMPYNSFKPILRPLSALYKTIVHNGKEIVPIVECAKMCFRHYPAKELIYNQIDENTVEIRSNKNRYELSYLGGFIVFGDNGQYTIPTNTTSVELFDYLHELKIDYRGLIDAGLAVDVNPYK